MIDQARLTSKLATRFGPISEVKPGILRTSDRFGDREYAVRYFDLTGNLGEAASRLREYQEDLMTETFFGQDSPADLRWSHYLYFVAGDEEAKAPEFHSTKVQIEADRTYARKAVLTEKELDALLAPTDKGPATPPADIASQWAQRLDALGLSFILDDAITAPEAARQIKAGRKQRLAMQAALAPLSAAEKVAGSEFLKALTITGFRKYPSPKNFVFGRVNLIVGRNGAGKTSLLEAIEYLYCGGNKRLDDISAGTRVVGEFFGSSARLTTSASTTKLPTLRARNAHWYAKADVKKPTLADSFGKFNFLDTDAAVGLSNNNDSEDRLRSDVARLLLGAEAEKLATKLARVGEKVDEAIRNTERDTDDIQRRISEARARLDALSKAPQTSDTIYADLLGALSKWGWKSLPATKHGATDLSAPLQAAVVAARQLARAASHDANTEPTILIERRAGLESALKKAEELCEGIKDLMRSRTAAQQMEASLQSRHLSIEALSRYRSAGLIEKSSQLAMLRARVDNVSARSAALGRALLDLGEMRDSDMRLDEVMSWANDAFRQLDVAVRERSAAVKALESTMVSVNVLRQRLMSTATELLAKVPDPDHCPVCRAQFEVGQLKLRMSTAAEDGGNELLADAQAGLREAMGEFDQARILQNALKALAAFVGPQLELSVRQAHRTVEESRATLEQDRLAINELERVIAQFAQDGLTEPDLHKRLAELGMASLPSADELATIQADCSNAIAAHTRSNEARENELAKSRLALADLTGAPAESANASPDVQLQHLRNRLADLDLQIAAGRILESVFDRHCLDDVPLELRLEQANDQLSRLLTALQSEAHAVSTAQAEANSIATLEDRLTEYSGQLDHMRSARTLINELLQKAKTGVFADQVMKANAATIGAIFAAIHAPNEFIVQTGNGGALTITREDTQQSVSLQQMSTGQRAAYALSLFLSMNLRLISGPPLLLLDDPIAHIDDLNTLSFLDYLREIAVCGSRQIFLATADDKLAGLFRQKFRFMGPEQFRELTLSRG
jgi:DNA repair protein SbcC/Rad50